MKPKKFFVAIALTFIVIPIFSQVVYSIPQPSPQPLQTVTANDQYRSNPLCYLTTDSGQIVDLSSICGEASPGSVTPVIYPPPPTVYDQGAIDSFDDALYGPD